MTLNDIKAAIVSKLQAELPSFNIYAEDIPRGFVNPALILKLTPADVQNRQYYKERTVKAKIIYAGTYQEMRDIAETLPDIFGAVLIAGQRSLTINGSNSEIIEADGGIYLQFTFEITFIEGNEVLELMTAQGETKVMLPAEELGYTAANVSFIGELQLNEQEE